MDDEEIVLHFATDALSTIGFKVTATSDQKEALGLIGSEKFDFILTDIKMPDIDGITLARRALEIDPELGVMFMTGYADVETAKKAIAAGAYDYIMKPFELAEIRHSVNTAVQKRKEINEKRGTKGLSQLSDLMGALYSVGESRSILKLVLGFALYHFDLKAGIVTHIDRQAGIIKLIACDNIRSSNFNEIESQPVEEIPSSLLTFNENVCSGQISDAPLFKELLSIPSLSGVSSFLKGETGHFHSYSLPATENSKLILTIMSERETPIQESDRQLLTVLLSLATISLDNLILFEEARKAMAHLEDMKDHLVGFERVATQGMMSSEIAHELNNFIAIISSNLELFEMKNSANLPPESRKYLDNVKKNIGKFEAFTKSLSDAGKMATNRQNASLNEMISEIVTFATHQKRFKRVRIELQLDPSLPEVYLDTSQLQQLLYNMLNNAADAIGHERKDGLIRISTQYFAETSQLMLVVKDNGCGFDTENLRKAFKDRFTTKKDGHGFGLTVCRKIIANHGGKIDVESTEGAGAEIRITLPCVDIRTAPTTTPLQ